MDAGESKHDAAGQAVASEAVITKLAAVQPKQEADAVSTLDVPLAAAATPSKPPPPAEASADPAGTRNNESEGERGAKFVEKRKARGADPADARAADARAAKSPRLDIAVAGKTASGDASVPQKRPTDSLAFPKFEASVVKLTTEDPPGGTAGVDDAKSKPAKTATKASPLSPVTSTAEEGTAPKHGQGEGQSSKAGNGDNEGVDDNEDDLDLSGMRQHEYEQVAKFDPAQLQRYEQYRRSDLKTAKIKKVLTAINPVLAKSSDHFLVAVKGLAKVFVGDVVEAALEVREHCGDSGPLQPKHLREAYRRLQRTGAIPTTNVREGGF